MALGKSLENILGNYFGETVVNLKSRSELNTALESDYPAKKSKKSVLKVKGLGEESQYEQSFSTKIDIKRSDEIKESQKLSNGVEEITVHSLKIDCINSNPYQTRTFFDEEKITSLAANIKENGLIQPIVVFAKTVESETSYFLLAGERRLRACKLLGWKSILCLVKEIDKSDEAHLSLVSAMENLQREDLSPLELASTFKMLIRTQNLDENGVAELLEKSVQYVRNYLRLLTLHPSVQEMLNQKRLTEGQARNLVGLDPESQLKIAIICQEKELTVKEIQRLIENLYNPKGDSQMPIRLKGYTLPPEYIQKSIKFSQSIPDSKIKYFGNEQKGKIVIYWDK